MADLIYSLPGDLPFNAWQTQKKRKDRNNVFIQPLTVDAPWVQLSPVIFSIDGSQASTTTVTWLDIFELGLSYRIIGTVERRVAGSVDFNNAGNTTTPLSTVGDFDIQIDITTDTGLTMDANSTFNGDVVITQIKRVL